MNVDAKKKQLLKTVQDHTIAHPGQSLTRADIARLLGKKQLNQTEKTLLEVLVSEGAIVAQDVPTYAPSKTRREYYLPIR